MPAENNIFHNCSHCYSVLVLTDSTFAFMVGKEYQDSPARGIVKLSTLQTKPLPVATLCSHFYDQEFLHSNSLAYLLYVAMPALNFHIGSLLQPRSQRNVRSQQYLFITYPSPIPAE